MNLQSRGSPLEAIRHWSAIRVREFAPDGQQVPVPYLGRFCYAGKLQMRVRVRVACGINPVLEPRPGRLRSKTLLRQPRLGPARIGATTETSSAFSCRDRTFLMHVVDGVVQGVREQVNFFAGNDERRRE